VCETKDGLPHHYFILSIPVPQKQPFQTPASFWLGAKKKKKKNQTMCQTPMA
jgi:hypothetical protein